MSYARFGWDGSDVYVFAHVEGYLCCCACCLQDDWKHRSTDAMLKHLHGHVAAGHTVPTYTITELEQDRAENDAWLAEAAAENQKEVTDA